MSIDRSHLTPKKVTDKNGKQTTVHVNDRKGDGAVNIDKLSGISASSGIGSKGNVNNWSMDELTAEEQSAICDRVAEGFADDEQTARDINEAMIEKIMPSDGLSDDDIDSVLSDPTRRGADGIYEDTEDGYYLREAQRSVSERMLREKVEERANELKNLDEDDEDRIPGDFNFDDEFDDDYLDDISERIDKTEHNRAYAQKAVDLSGSRGFEYTAGRVSKEQIKIGDDREIAKEVLPDDATEEEIEQVSKSVRDLVNSELTGNDSMKIDLLWNGKPSEVIKGDSVPDTASPSNENGRATWRVQANGFSHYAPYPAKRMEMNTFSGDRPQMSVSDDIMVMNTTDDE